MYIELWKWIPGWEGYYMASTHGRIKSVDRYVNGNGSSKFLIKGRILKGTPDKDGYILVILSKHNKKKGFHIHRLVALTFIPNPNNWPQVNHIDENKTNNTVENLEWCTAKYNSNYGTHIERYSQANRKPILMFTKDGQFIQRFNCVAEANKYLGKNTGNKNIYQCLTGFSKTAYGYIWKYEQP